MKLFISCAVIAIAITVLFFSVKHLPLVDSRDTTVPDNAEPYQIKIGDDLGISLGTSLAAFKQSRKLRNHRACTDVPADDEVSCNIFIDYDSCLQIGELKICSIMPTFYQNKLIYVWYGIVGYDRDTLLQGLKDKFGKPIFHYSIGYEWRNSVSEITFYENEKDLSPSRLQIELTKEMNEWLKRSVERHQAEANKEL